MKTVSGKIASTKPISLSRAANSLSNFVNSDNGASQSVFVYLCRASAAFNELLYFKKHLKHNKHRPEEKDGRKHHKHKKQPPEGEGVERDSDMNSERPEENVVGVTENGQDEGGVGKGEGRSRKKEKKKKEKKRKKVEGRLGSEKNDEDKAEAEEDIVSEKENREEKKKKKKKKKRKSEGVDGGEVGDLVVSEKKKKKRKLGEVGDSAGSGKKKRRRTGADD